MGFSNDNIENERLVEFFYVLSIFKYIKITEQGTTKTAYVQTGDITCKAQFFAWRDNHNNNEPSVSRYVDKTKLLYQKL